ncbi:MAG TPA: flagellar biosynthesis protein FlhB [Desulfuromonadales bacterium]|nr:flagellar biosynthesis protein FlhB [Desulfuromonadales bacterium]
MGEESDQEKTEPATGKRRKDFREKGQVAQSREVTSVAILSSVLLLWTFSGAWFWERLSHLATDIWRISGTYPVTQLSIANLLVEVLLKMGILLAPIFLLVMIVGFFGTFLQIGWLFTTKTFEVDPNKFNPISGMKQFVSARAMVELVKSLAKVVLVGWVAYQAVRSEFAKSLYLVDMDVVATLKFFGQVAGEVLAKSCGVLAVLAGLDYLFVRWDMEKKMRMTKQEIKEEHKETEGDPQIKSRIRSLQMQMARRRMMAEVPKADVVITNPTHLAVALSYRRGEMDAPQVVAKGADQVAAKIREIAREHRVPLVENVPVARALYQVDLGSAVPEELFKAVAEILAYVYGLKGQRK